MDKGFWSTVSAFANTRGGIIVLGVSEDQQRGTFEVNPDFNYRRAADRVADAFRPSKEDPGVTPIPRTSIEADEFEDKPVIVITV